MMAAPAASPELAAGFGGMQAAVVADDLRSTQLTNLTQDDAYKIILAEANGAAVDATPDSDPTAAQYKAIGADIGDAADSKHSNNLALLNDKVMKWAAPRWLQRKRQCCRAVVDRPIDAQRISRQLIDQGMPRGAYLLRGTSWQSNTKY